MKNILSNNLLLPGKIIPARSITDLYVLDIVCVSFKSCAMSYQGCNLYYLYIIDGEEYSKYDLTTALQQRMGPTEATAFNVFKNKVLHIVGADGYATIKIFPGNNFRAFLPNGNELTVV